jgi:hypothetical protein
MGILNTKKFLFGNEGDVERYSFLQNNHQSLFLCLFIQIYTNSLKKKKKKNARKIFNQVDNI